MARPRGAVLKGIYPLLFKNAKIESCVTFTPNLIPKSLKTHHFLNETSKFETQLSKNSFFRFKNAIFSKFRQAPR